MQTIIIIVIQPLGRSGQRPEFSQATGMAMQISTKYCYIQSEHNK